MTPPLPSTCPARKAPDIAQRARSRAWDATSGREIRSVLWRAADVLDLAVDRTSRQFAASFASGALSVWNLTDWTELILRQPPEPKANGPTAPTELPTWMPDPVAAPGTAYHSLAFTLAGRRLLAAAKDETMAVWIIPADRPTSASPGPNFATGSLVPAGPATHGTTARARPACGPPAWSAKARSASGIPHRASPPDVSHPR